MEEAEDRTEREPIESNQMRCGDGVGYTLSSRIKNYSENKSTGNE
jgi:hypothetical protein